MGYMNAIAMVEQTDLQTALHWHLRSNHFPPVPTTMIEPCIQAIDAILADEPNELIDLPEGTLWRGREAAPAWAIAEAHHLGPWIDQDDYEEDDPE